MSSTKWFVFAESNRDDDLGSGRIETRWFSTKEDALAAARAEAFGRGLNPFDPPVLGPGGSLVVGEDGSTTILVGLCEEASLGKRSC
jgi:hypothetical protein